MLSSIVLYHLYASKRGIIHTYMCSMKKMTQSKTLKIAFGVSFLNLCVGSLLVQTTRFVVKHLQKHSTCKAETGSSVHKLPSLYENISRITFIQLIFFLF
jgi:hypothetical protein